jgi:hypothetical protein
VKPAFYALSPGGWRDYVTLLHPPYTLWHLSYVAIGAGLAARLDGPRLVATFAAFFLAMGIGAHALDELNGRPLQTRIPDGVLIALAAVSIGAAAAIGVVLAIGFDLWLLAFVAVGSFIVVAYNLELFGGRFHSDLWFALAWGAFPLLTAYFAMTGRLRADAVVAAAFAALLSLAQRRLSTPVRAVRRQLRSVDGTVAWRDGREEPVTPALLTAGAEGALRALTLATVALGAALLLQHAVR